MLALCPWCVPLRASCRRSGMYQISFLATVISSAAWRMRPSELAEPLLARHQIGAARLEYGPALLGESLREEPKHGGFPDELFAADQQ